MKIVITPESGVNIVEKDGMIEKVKSVSLAELQGIFTQDQTLTTGLMPQGTIYYSRSEQSLNVIIEVPAQTMLITGYSFRNNHRSQENRIEREARLPIPNTLFAFKVSRAHNRILDTLVFSTKLPVLGNVDRELYYFPYGNIFEGGRVCWGRVVLPDIDDLGQLRNIADLFFQAPFNGDLLHFCSPCDSLNEVFDRFVGENSYPSSLLVRPQSQSTVRRLLERINYER